MSERKHEIRRQQVVIPESESQEAVAAERPEKRSYASPEVFLVGELEELLLGGTPGSGDSGPNFAVENPLAR